MPSTHRWDTIEPIVEVVLRISQPPCAYPVGSCVTMLDDYGAVLEQDLATWMITCEMSLT